MVYNGNMNAEATKRNAQEALTVNVGMLLAVSHAKRQDLAKAMGKFPTALSRMLSGKQVWYFNDAAAAADFFKIDLNTISRDDLTPMEAKELLAKSEISG